MNLIKISVTLILFLSTILNPTRNFAQVTGVKYVLSFNEATGLFDAGIVIAEGQATSAVHRTQFNAQYSFLVPAGSDVNISKRYMPLQDHQEYKGFVPCDWKIASIVKSPEIMPDKDFYGIIPTLGPSAQYNDLKKNDTVRIFSIAVTPIPNNKGDVRLFENSKDPSATSKGMSGANFTNGFTIGGLQQRYAGNIVLKKKKSDKTKKMDKK